MLKMVTPSAANNTKSSAATELVSLALPSTPPVPAEVRASWGARRAIVINAVPSTFTSNALANHFQALTVFNGLERIPNDT